MTIDLDGQDRELIAAARQIAGRLRKSESSFPGPNSRDTTAAGVLLALAVVIDAVCDEVEWRARQ